MESDTKANIDPDHYPVIGTFRTKPRGISTLGKHRSRFEKLATYRKTKETEGITNETITKETHEQLDYWLVPNRWKSSFKKMESDTTANIESDHYPVIGTFKIKLRGISTMGKHRSRFEQCTEEDNNNTNQLLTDNTTTNIKE